MKIAIPKKIPTLVKVISAVILLSVILITGCVKSDPHLNSINNFSSYRNIPGVTESEIKAVEELQNRGMPFIYAAPHTAEAFNNENGEVGGFTALLCEWLTVLFDIPFLPVIKEPDSIITGLETGEVSFTSLVRTGDHEAVYLMTRPMVQRPYNMMQLSDNQPQLDGAFLSPISMTAKDPALSPVISIINKALENGGTGILAELYKQGYGEYLAYMFRLQLTDEEKAYIRNSPVIPFAAQYFAYPNSFYDKREEKWDGIIFDLLKEMEALTGLTFELIHGNHIELSETIRLLENGTVNMLPNLVPNEERMKMFIHSENIYMSDRFALISKRHYRNIEINDIPNERVGLAKGSAFTGFFREWFPDSVNTREYPTIDDAFIGLDRGEVDLVMSSKSTLASMNNYYGFSEYKANYLFDTGFDFGFWYNKEHALLCSILDKAFPLVNTERIVEQWLTVSYNYDELMMREQRPWLFGAIFLSLCVIFLIAMLFIKSRNAGIQLKELVASQTSTITAIFDAAPDFIFCKDLQSRYTKCNRSMEVYFNVLEKDIIGKGDSEALGLPDSIAEQFIKEDKKVIEEKQVMFFEEEMPSSSGKQITIETIKAPVIQDGKVTGVMGISRDITERKASMEALHKAIMEKDAYAALQNIFNGLDVMVHATDPKTNTLLFINDFMKKHYNIADDCIGQLCYEVLRGKKGGRCGFCPCNRLDKEQDSVIIWEEHDVRTNRFYRNKSQYINWIDGRTVYFHQAVDITDMKYELMKYELTRDALGIGLWDMEVVREDPVNPNNPFIWSQELRRMLGFNDENDLPNVLSSWIDRLHPEDRDQTVSLFAEHINDHTGKTILNGEYRFMLKNGEYRHFHAFGTTLRDNNGAPLRVAGALEDIQEKKQIEWERNNANLQLREALEQANAANHAKSDFLSHMSHEMRTPLNAIFGMTAIGINAGNAEQKDYALKKIEGASSHLLGVINDVLDMAKIEANKLELSPVEFNFNKMLQKTVSFIKFLVEEKRQKLFVNVDKNIPNFIIGDDQRLTQVIANLLSNAVKFTQEEGEIHLSAFLETFIPADPEIGISETCGGICKLRIEVADTGIGISEEQQIRLFQAFEQAESGTSRKYGGTGLGLVISKNIVELMDGKIWVESEVGKGSRFIFTIKAQYVDKDPGLPENDFNKKTTNIKDVFKNKKMLLAEDVEINREILIALLAETGITIDCAENGREALDMIESEYEKYDIVFMDVQMPKMDGLEATRLIREFEAKRLSDYPKEDLNDTSLEFLKETPRQLGHALHVPIVAMTANVFKSDIDECIKAGMDDHLGKPLIIDTVLEKLFKYLPEDI